MIKMQNRPDEQQIAQHDSWKTMEMPATVASLPFKKTYTSDEFTLISHGLIPEEMEDKWFIFMQDNTLSLHRSWEGECIYNVIFEQSSNEYMVKEALVNIDLEQYNRGSDSDEIALLSWLIDVFLLHKRVPFPMPSDVPKDLPPGLYQYHVSGTGFPEVKI
jgi:hypothetical protein